MFTDWVIYYYRDQSTETIQPSAIPVLQMQMERLRMCSRLTVPYANESAPKGGSLGMVQPFGFLYSVLLTFVLIVHTR